MSFNRWFCVASLFCCLPVFSQTTSSTPVVEIDGAKLTMADLEAQKPTLFFQGRNKQYEADRSAIESYVNDLVLEREAKKQGVTVEQLLKANVDSKLGSDPSEDTLKWVYEASDASNQPFEAVRGQIAQALKQRRAAKARSAYIQGLRQQAKVNIVLPQPQIRLNTDGLVVRGPKNAPVTLVEYADYECPYCQQVKPIIDRLKADYKDKLAFVYKDAPLQMHPNAQKAAEAVHCAGAQGKYWEFHDLLYSSKQLDVAQLKQGAQTLQLNAAAFSKCLDSGENYDLVRKQLSEFESLGLPGTPSFFINGKLINGGTTYERLRELIDQELAGAPAKPSGGKSGLE